MNFSHKVHSPQNVKLHKLAECTVCSRWADPWTFQFQRACGFFYGCSEKMRFTVKKVLSVCIVDLGKRLMETLQKIKWGRKRRETKIQRQRHRETCFQWIITYREAKVLRWDAEQKSFIGLRLKVTVLFLFWSLYEIWKILDIASIFYKFVQKLVPVSKYYLIILFVTQINTVKLHPCYYGM